MLIKTIINSYYVLVKFIPAAGSKGIGKSCNSSPKSGVPANEAGNIPPALTSVLKCFFASELQLLLLITTATAPFTSIFKNANEKYIRERAKRCPERYLSRQM